MWLTGPEDVVWKKLYFGSLGLKMLSGRRCTCTSLMYLNVMERTVLQEILNETVVYLVLAYINEMAYPCLVSTCTFVCIVSLLGQPLCEWPSG